MTKRRSSGMTLIELMVVVAIVGILIGVAYPAYRQYVVRTKRTEARAALLEVSQALEKCYTRYFAYDHDDCTAVTSFTTAKGTYDIAPADEEVEDPSGPYSEITPGIQATSFVMRAQARGGQATGDPQCAVMTIDSAGRKTPQACW